MGTGGRKRKRHVNRLDAADCTSIETLYRQHSGWLARALSARFRTTAIEVDDIVQETYERVARYESSEAARNPKALLMRIAVNLARDHMRKNVVRGGLAPMEDADFETIPSPGDQHHLLQIKQSLLALPPIYRDVFVLNRFTGLTYGEIASHVGISVKAVEWRMSRALAMIMVQMQD